MVEIKKYKLPPTRLIPNSPYPLLHYPGILSKEAGYNAAKIWETFHTNGWETQWIFRYGPTQRSHYHSQAHECMAVLTGEATIRFGVADTSADLEASTRGSAREEGGIELHAKAGDVFILPAGTAHKTYDTTESSFALLTPGGGKELGVDDPKRTMREIESSGELRGFTMMGCYPRGSSWDFAVGGENDGHFEEIWDLPRPAKDPVLGDSVEGLLTTWSYRPRSRL